MKKGVSLYQDQEEFVSVECLGTTSRDAVPDGTRDEDQDLRVRGRAGLAQDSLSTACLPNHSVHAVRTGLWPGASLSPMPTTELTCAALSGTFIKSVLTL